MSKKKKSGKSPTRAQKTATSKAKHKAQGTKKTTTPIPIGLQEKSTEGAPTAAQSSLFKKIFLASAGLMFVLMSIFSFDFGISGDEYDMAEYGKKASLFYTSFGSDTSAFTMKVDRDKVFKYYGAGFDVAADAFEDITGLPEYEARHLLNSWVGWGAMLVTGLMLSLIVGWRGALIGLWIIFLSPRFFGHSMNNPKDIPFAFGFVLALYGFTRLLRDMPTPSRKSIIISVLGIMLAIGSRVGGLLLIPYLFLFLAVDYIARYYYPKALTQLGTFLPMARVKRYTMYAVGIGAAGYFLGLLLWPYGILGPLSHPFETLERLSNQPITIRVLFEGAHVKSDQLPAYYLIKYIFITVPLIVLLGGALFLGMQRILPKYFDKRYMFIIGFSFAFPLLYIAYKDSNVFGGWRQVAFVYPSFVMLATVGIEGALRHWKAQKPIFYGVLAAVALSLGQSLYWYVYAHPYQQTYFNTLAGGLSGAKYNYETDYYYNSVKEASDWLKESGELTPKADGKRIVIATNAFPQVLSYFRGDTTVKIEYTHYANRHQKNWDYGIFHYKFVDRSQIMKGSFPPANSIHTVTLSDMPFSTVVKRTSRADLQAFQALQGGRIDEVITLADSYLQETPTDVQVRSWLARAYMQKGQLDKAIEVAQANEAYHAQHGNSLLVMAQIYSQRQQFAESWELCKKILDDRDNNSFAHYLQAVNEANLNRTRSAADHAIKSIAYNPQFKQGYALAGQLLQQLGSVDSARAFIQAGK